MNMTDNKYIIDLLLKLANVKSLDDMTETQLIITLEILERLQAN